jgi:hypothetical protein
VYLFRTRLQWAQTERLSSRMRNAERHGPPSISILPGTTHEEKRTGRLNCGNYRHITHSSHFRRRKSARLCNRLISTVIYKWSNCLEHRIEFVVQGGFMFVTRLLLLCFLLLSKVALSKDPPSVSGVPKSCAVTKPVPHSSSNCKLRAPNDGNGRVTRSCPRKCHRQ